MVKLTKCREVTIPHDDFSITWKFPMATEIEMTKARSIVRATVKETKVAADEDYIFDVYLMNSIHKVSGFIDEDTGEEIKDLTLDVKKIIYDYVKGTPDYWVKVIVAYQNVKGKNSESGQTHSLTGTGDQTSAPSVTPAQMETVPSSEETQST